jgi:hypothetical protein
MIDDDTKTEGEAEGGDDAQDKEKVEDSDE